MTPPVAPKNQTPFDDEISLLDIIQFFKTHFKRILFFIILGGILGYLYGKLADPVYDGSVLVSPALVAGNYVIDPKITLTKLNMSSYYSKETFLACNPTFYKDKDKDKDIDYDMSDIVKASITKDGNLIELKMQSSNKETIHACLESIVSNINANQKTIADPLIESKKTELNLVETKLKLAEEFREQLNDKQIKNLKTNEQRFSTDVFYANIVLNTASEIKTLLDQINKVRTELSSEQTKDAGKVLPINIERNSFPSEKLGLY
jgi:uncharacterized protein involved in exopolysaccharide biosynthesis